MTRFVSTSSRSRARRRGFTIIEVLVALGVCSVVLTLVTRQLIDVTRVSLSVTSTLEHSRNAREFMDTLAADVRSAQILIVHPDFTTRDVQQWDGQSGNYLVLHRMDPRGTITRTVGYYAVNLGGKNGWAVYRHDSALGDNAAGALPAAGSEGSHRRIKRAVRLSSSSHLLTCTGDSAVSIEGEFSTADTIDSGRTEFIQCTFSSRS